MRSGWVPITPRGRPVWHCADNTKMEAEFNACFDGANRERFGSITPCWHQLQELGWTVKRCALSARQ